MTNRNRERLFRDDRCRCQKTVFVEVGTVKDGKCKLESVKSKWAGQGATCPTFRQSGPAGNFLQADDEGISRLGLLERHNLHVGFVQLDGAADVPQRRRSAALAVGIEDLIARGYVEGRS